MLNTLRSAWRKNKAEIGGLFSNALPDFVLAGRPRELLPGVPVFCYHLVEPESFEADLAYLAINGYETVDCQEFLSYLRNERALPERSVLLTFDDGARNFFDVAFPLLRHFGARATAFIAPGLHRNAEDELDIEARPMTWEEITRVYESGLVVFQTHTLESRFVPDWPSPAALAGCCPSLEASRRGLPLSLNEDLARSRRLIEERLPGMCGNQLAFPMYLGTDEALVAARAVGIEACYWGLRAGRPLNCSGDNPYLISRLSDEFLRRLPGDRRLTLRDLVRNRLRRIRLGRAWRQRYGE